VLRCEHIVIRSVEGRACINLFSYEAYKYYIIS
jgi:hypothetical protein